MFGSMKSTSPAPSMFRVPPATGAPASFPAPDPDGVAPPLLHAASTMLATAVRDSAARACRLLAIGPPPGLDSAEGRTFGPDRNRGHASVKQLSRKARA